MVYLNFSNIEKLVFENEEVRQVLPVQYFSFFEQWKLGRMVPMLKQIGRMAMIDLLNALTDEDVALLDDFFGDRVVVEKLNYHAVENIVVPLKDSQYVCQKLCEITQFMYFSTWRDENYLYISLWR